MQKEPQYQEGDRVWFYSFGQLSAGSIVKVELLTFPEPDKEKSYFTYYINHCESWVREDYIVGYSPAEDLPPGSLVGRLRRELSWK